MQAAANRPVAPRNPPLGIAAIDYYSGSGAAFQRKHISSAVYRGLSGRAAPQVSRSR
jgi:hypothetical protein